MSAEGRPDAAEAQRRSGGRRVLARAAVAGDPDEHARTVLSPETARSLAADLA